MAQLVITVDDAQVARVRTAYGANTNAELRSMIISDIRSRVVNYEVGKAHTDGESSVRIAQQNVIASAESAKTSAEAISIT